MLSRFMFIYVRRLMGGGSMIQRDKTMVDKLMHIPNNDKQFYPFCRLQLVVETFGHLT